MIDRDRQAAIYALRQARQGIDVALSMLEAAEQSGACQHKRKQDTGGMGGGDNWYCPDCRLEVRDGKPVQKAAVPPADQP